jgi:large subunit ribosomal protein L17
MNHKIRGRRFGRYSAHRCALIMNLSKELIDHERVCTTLPKAKDLRPVVEKLVTLGKRGDLHARKQAISFFSGDIRIVTKLFDAIAAKCKERNGGYLRIMKCGNRKGDNAPMALIEFVEPLAATAQV